MPELRWALAALGVLFLAGLAWWELRRPRQARGGELTNPSPRTIETSAPEGATATETLELPQMRAREPVAELPHVELSDDSLGTLVERRREGRLEPTISSDGPESERRSDSGSTGHSVDWPDAEAQGLDEPSGAPELLLRGRVAPLAAPSDPIVDWPEESVRRVLAVRLVAPAERFSGRAVRQALAAEGFVLGKFAIFHRPGPDGRAVLSAANLNKPGTFAAEAMDMQRLAGLNLFCVLPGPLTPTDALEELLTAGRNLNDRLHGALQDEHGEPLTSLRAAALREALAESI